MSPEVGDDEGDLTNSGTLWMTGDRLAGGQGKGRQVHLIYRGDEIMDDQDEDKKYMEMTKVHRAASQMGGAMGE